MFLHFCFVFAVCVFTFGKAQNNTYLNNTNMLTDEVLRYRGDCMSHMQTAEDDRNSTYYGHMHNKSNTIGNSSKDFHRKDYNQSSYPGYGYNGRIYPEYSDYQNRDNYNHQDSLNRGQDILTWSASHLEPTDGYNRQRSYPGYLRKRSDVQQNRTNSSTRNMQNEQSRGSTSLHNFFNRRVSDNVSHLKCFSQCIFGYMEIMDDNGVPSETAMLKWIQDKVRNDDQRNSLMRDVRKCFGTLATTDKEDGCTFSHMLSKCLNLETEETDN